MTTRSTQETATHAGDDGWRVVEGDCAEVLPTLAADSADLAILDPPYFRVVGESWDRQWRTEADYRQWAATWIREVSRILRLGGTAYLFGYIHTLMQLVPLFDGFDLRQQIIVSKGLRSISGRHTKRYKMFPVTTESIAFLVKDSKPYIRELLLERQRALGLSAKEINERLGVKSNGGGMWSLYTGENILGQVPTLDLWKKLSDVLAIDVPYARFAQTFHLPMGLTDVWSDIDFYADTAARDRDRVHKTQKPYALIRRLIEASSNVGDTVLDPFAGSGTAGVVATRLGRRVVLIEKDPTARERMTAEEQGTTVQAQRAGQLALLGKM